MTSDEVQKDLCNDLAVMMWLKQQQTPKSPFLWVPFNHQSIWVVSHIFYFPFHIWDVIRNPLTKSIIFQDGYCTTNQVNYSDYSGLTLTSRRDRTLESWLGFGELSQYVVVFQVIELVQFAQNCKHCTNTNIYIYNQLYTYRSSMSKHDLV